MKKALLEISPKIELRLSSIHLGVLSVLMLLHAFEIIQMDPLVFRALISWVAINLLAFPIARKRFITPSVANPKCPYCGGNLISTELYCEKCKSTSKAYKEKQ
jgi:hypothetical protein